MSDPSPRQTASLSQLHPRRRRDLEVYSVAGEAVLAPPSGDQIYALNESGRAILELCDGRHDLPGMVGALRSQFEGQEAEVLADVAGALLQLQALGLVETGKPVIPGVDRVSDARPPVHLVYGIEDRAYFHWQLAILFESLSGQLPPGWEVLVVVCNNHQSVSKELEHICDTYGVRYLLGAAHADNQSVDFAGGDVRYVALNRIEALNVAGEHVAPDDLVCLMDTDTFLFGDLQEELFPTGNAMAANWIVDQNEFFSFAAEGEGGGVDLQKLLEAIGCSTPLKRGGVTIFLTGETVQNKKVIQDCFRFAQILYLLGKVKDLPVHGVWVAEMACFAMALTPNGVDYELLDTPQFAVQDQAAKELPSGSFFHYYTDINDNSGSAGPFFGSEWHKQLFHDRNFLREDLGSFASGVKDPVGIRFFEVAERARRRLYGKD